jgi:tRNA modification GTPase
MREHDPIAALASGSGAAAVAVVRLSGERCHALLAPCLQPAGGPRPTEAWPERTLKLARILDPKTGETVDEALVTLFHGPRSFTGEDAAEIHAHGGPYVVRRVLGVLFAQGFRQADPGEFTRRAFLNGKMDLTEAEGIRELVEAESHQQWIAARHLASGRLRVAIETLRQRLVETLAYLEAQIDFPDEGDTAHVDRTHVRDRATEVAKHVGKLLRTYDSGRVASRGLMVALVGAPNAGKSTLMNELLGKERAIVTAIPGTTRDWLEERCLVDGRLLRLVDMAGLREDPDPVEAIGIAAARRLAKDADLVLFLVPADASEAAAAEIERWKQELAPRDAVTLLTKVDLGRPPWGEELTAISCRSGLGMEGLRRLLVDKVDRHLGKTGSEEAFVTTARHVAALTDAEAALAAFFAADRRHESVELLAFELQQAVRALRAIIGDVGTDDVLDKIFREFCVGK